MKGVKRVSDLPGAPPFITVHRVVDMGHPTYQDAKQGICRPWGDMPQEVTVDASLAMTEGTRPGTGLTCWSTDVMYSMGLAKPGDIVMITRVPSNEAYIPFNPRPRESEVHLFGTVRDCKVIVKR
jgi:hypothetical protein